MNTEIHTNKITEKQIKEKLRLNPDEVQRFRNGYETINE